MTMVYAPNSEYALIETTPAITPTGTHVNHVALWLLLLLAKTMLFSFLKVWSVDITFVKKFGIPALWEILGLT